VSRQAELNDGLSTVTAGIDVIVGILTDPRGRVLIGRRQAGKHMAGAWEFPGGKLETGEAPLAGLRRELAEELGIRVYDAEPLLERRFQYPDRAVRLDVWWVLSYEGRARPCEGQQLSWVDAEALSDRDMLPADGPIVAAVRERLAGR
jgi:8-oxo-dGTP diphosphatase